MLRSENEIVFPFEKCIIFTVVPFIDYLSHLGRGLYNYILYYYIMLFITSVQSLCLFAIKYV